MKRMTLLVVAAVLLLLAIAGCSTAAGKFLDLGDFPADGPRQSEPGTPAALRALAGALNEKGAVDRISVRWTDVYGSDRQPRELLYDVGENTLKDVLSPDSYAGYEGVTPAKLGELLRTESWPLVDDLAKLGCKPITKQLPDHARRWPVVGWKTRLVEGLILEQGE